VAASLHVAGFNLIALVRQKRLGADEGRKLAADDVALLTLWHPTIYHSAEGRNQQKKKKKNEVGFLLQHLC